MTRCCPLLVLWAFGCGQSDTPPLDFALDKPVAREGSSDTPRATDLPAADRAVASEFASGCGDQVCEVATETCQSCPADCGACAVCGDKACDPGEDCFNCENDCGSCCGNGTCDKSFGETCESCSKDCGACCGNGTCEGSETCVSCPADCGSCITSCGNGTCESGETCKSCKADCGACCGNGKCEPLYLETCAFCPADCGKCCGNGTCETLFNETCTSCPADCGTCCGNGACELVLGENCHTCAKDCGKCSGTSCATLAGQYATMLAAAKVCTSSTQCKASPYSSIGCSCPVRANASSSLLPKLTALRLQYQKECMTAPCSGALCEMPPQGVCSSGSCKP